MIRLARRGPDVAFGHRFRPPPYGGSNQFLLALRGELERRGYRVGEEVVGRRTRACLLNAHAFDADAIRRGLHPGCRVVHRIDGPLLLYRGFDDGSDERIRELNRELAHATVAQSRFSLYAYVGLGFELAEPTVIPNAVDPELFHPPQSRRPLGGRRVRLVCTSWSDNPNKRAEVFGRLAERLDPERFECTFAGRTPVPLPAVRVLPPLDSRRLGELLREQDVFVAPSRHDPASNAVLEALACGLPVLYARSGGHPELVGEAGLSFDDPDELPSLLERLLDEYEKRRARISIPSLAETADRYLETMGLA
jgi:glycosyltransferase involved in cell wall biosynthesis